MTGVPILDAWIVFELTLLGVLVSGCSLVLLVVWGLVALDRFFARREAKGEADDD